jgi:ATP-dependent DNA helicase RecG
MTAADVTHLLKELNLADEHPRLEAKSGLGASLYETLCAFANEPDLGGGIVLLGVSRAEDDMFGAYTVSGVADPDQASQQIATACATQFNLPLRPRITPVVLTEGIVLVVEVDELESSHKPLFFKSQGLPRGAWRRIGTTDQRCTEDDLRVFFADRDRQPFDATPLPGTTWADVDPEAVDHYRRLRGKVSPTDESLGYSDEELLQTLRALVYDAGTPRLTLTGLLVFGKRSALRRELPAMRVDYIRVPGKEWVADPERRYEASIDMRGPLLQLVDRAQAAVLDDLPRGFDLPEGSIQAASPSLPARAIREAIVNALMHRSYRLHQPTQIIRYSNRIEILNAGYSLKNPELLGSPGSQLRNPNLAAIFHETNTAETKGTGIRVMRELMRAHEFSAPTFESDRAGERFTARFLLHHFLTEPDLRWLAALGQPDLSEAQRYALIFVRESGAIDNPTLRQLTGEELLVTSKELIRLRDLGFLVKKGAGTATYYLPGPRFPAPDPTGPDQHTLDAGHGTLAPSHGTLAHDHGTLAHDHGTLASAVPVELQTALTRLGPRPGMRLRPLILHFCRWRPLKATEMAALLGGREFQALRRDHLRPLVDLGHLRLTHPEMERHPDQAYQTAPELDLPPLA